MSTPCRTLPQGRAFTLIELLVAMAVLALVMVMLLQVVTQIMQSTSIQNRQMDSAATARRALDIMAIDLRGAVIDGGATILLPKGSGDSNLFSLVAKRRGPTNLPDHRLLAISYATNSSNQLTRSYASAGYASPNLFHAAANSATSPARAISSGVLGVSIHAITRTNSHRIADTPSTDETWASETYGSATNLPSGFKALITPRAPFLTNWDGVTRSLEIWIAATDPQTTKLLEASGKKEAIEEICGNKTIEPKEWREKIDESPEIPSVAKSSIRVLSKRIPLQ